MCGAERTTSNVLLVSQNSFRQICTKDHDLYGDKGKGKKMSVKGGGAAVREGKKKRTT